MARAKYTASKYSYLGPIGSVEVAELDWGNQEQAEALNPPFDYIVATDVVCKIPNFADWPLLCHL